MDQSEMLKALKRAQDREQAIKGATLFGFILAVVFTYYSPSGLWFHGDGIGFKNVLLFLFIEFLITAGIWWLIDKAYSKPDQ